MGQLPITPITKACVATVENPMKIGQTPDALAAKAAATAPKAAAQAAAEAQAAPAQARSAGAAQTASVAVSVSPVLQKTVRNASGDVDMAKVNAVRQAIKDGTFKINPEAIADRMLDNAAEMLRLTRA